MDKPDDRGYMPVAIVWIVLAMVVAGGSVFNTKAKKLLLKNFLEPKPMHILSSALTIFAIVILCLTPWAVHPLSPTADRVPTWVSFWSLTLLCFSVLVICVTVFPNVCLYTIPVVLLLYYTYVVGAVENVSKTCTYTSTAMYIGGLILWALQYFTRHQDELGIEAIMEHVRTLYKSRGAAVKELDTQSLT